MGARVAAPILLLNMTKLEGNLTPNVRINAKGDNSLLVVRWGSQVVRH